MTRRHCGECENEGFVVDLKVVYDQTQRRFRKIGQYCPRCFYFYPDEELRFRLAIGEANYKNWIEQGRNRLETYVTREVSGDGKRVIEKFNRLGMTITRVGNFTEPQSGMPKKSVVASGRKKSAQELRTWMEALPDDTSEKPDPVITAAIKEIEESKDAEDVGRILEKHGLRELFEAISDVVTVQEQDERSTKKPQK